VIIVRISSSKRAGEVPTMIPAEVNGYGPLNWLSKSVIAACSFMITRFFFCWAAGMAESWAS
jgi:hypothetical protein